MRLAVPAITENSRSGTLTELARQQGHHREQAEQVGCGAGHSTVRPWPLGLPRMGAHLLNGDLDLPAQDERADDLQRILPGISA